MKEIVLKTGRKGGVLQAQRKAAGAVGISKGLWSTTGRQFSRGDGKIGEGGYSVLDLSNMLKLHSIMSVYCLLYYFSGSAESERQRAVLANGYG